MTRDEIRTMEAGREMDTLIAERVMGWTPCPVEGTDEVAWLHEKEGFAALQWTGYLSDYIYGFRGELHSRLEDGGVLTAAGVAGTVWNPSDDIAAAWQVVGKMLSSGIDFSMANTENLADFQWGVDFYIMIDEAAVAKVFSANGPTAPLTICRAALLATLEAE